MPEVAAGGYRPGEDTASHAVCARALKLAAQYNHVNDAHQVCCHQLSCHRPALAEACTANEAKHERPDCW